MHLYLQCKITFIDEFDAVLVLEHFSNMSAEQQATQLLILCNTGLQCGCDQAHHKLESVQVSI